MTSNSIYIPYFYIIKHIPSNQCYAGSRWAKGCNPSEFMKLGGYTTSSLEIERRINEDGLTSFEILRVDTFCDNLHPYEYETLFLKTLNCANSDEWINTHNNDGMAFGTDEFIRKAKITTNSNYGVDYALQSPIVQSKIKSSLLEKYGVDNIAKTSIERTKSSARANIEVTCPHCLKTGQKIMMHRDHFDRCKLNPNRVAKPVKNFICPYCGKSSTNGTIMGRWHFDKCKLKSDKICDDL